VKYIQGIIDPWDEFKLDREEFRDHQTMRAMEAFAEETLSLRDMVWNGKRKQNYNS